MTPLDSSSLNFWETMADWGMIIVIIGVAGEGVEILAKLAFHRWYERHEKLVDVVGFIFWVMVVFGLAIEFRGDHKSKEIADGANAQLTYRASSNEVQVAILSTNVLQLAHEYDLSTNALAEANARLAAIRPVKERLIELLNQINPEILSVLKTGQIKFHGMTDSYEYNALRGMANEPGASAYIRSVKISGGGAFSPEGEFFNVSFELGPALAQ